MRVLFLTAGNGSRIRAISKCRSKCMLPVNGRPLLAWQMDQCAETGMIEKIHVVIHRDEREIQSYFGKEYRGIPLVYHVQTDMENGLVGAIFAVDDPEFYEDHSMLVLGDEYFADLDFKALLNTFCARPDSVLVLTVPTDDAGEIQKNYTVKLGDNNRIVKAVEKPEEPFNNLIGTGIVVFPKAVLRDFAHVNFPLSGKNLQLVDIIEFAPKAYAYIKDCAFCNLNTVGDYAALCLEHVPEDRNEKLADAFRRVAAACAQRTAVVCGTEHVTYGELDKQSDRLCERLVEMGCKPGNCIALMCSRTIEHMTAMLGVLKAGCYYLPVDDKLPKERIEYMIKKARAVCTIVLENVDFSSDSGACSVVSYERLMGGTSEICPDIECGEAEPGSPELNYAYVIFTSGSTGVPKGAVISQLSVMNLVHRIQEEAFSLVNKDILEVGVMASFAFDLSVQQIWPSLLGGHTLHIVPYEAKLRPADLICELNRLDACDGTPLIMQLINQYLISHREVRLGLKLYLSAGEELKKNVIHTFFQHCPECIVINCYGPTECTVETTLFPMNRTEELQLQVIPIGKPIKYTRIYILNEDRKLLCPGVTGDIWIAGAGVGEGYIYDDRLTDKAFFEDILCPEDTMYRTGDRGYWGKDGNLYYAGRGDNQVKFKGYRIELGEIERAVETVDGIILCKVLLTEMDSGQDNTRRCLTAYYVADRGKEISQSMFCEQLAAKLPEYMIPQQYIPVENFVMNNNGKLDRTGLEKSAQVNINVVKKPADRLTEKVNLCIRQVCPGQIKDGLSLISQGVDSLMLISLLCEVEEQFGIELDISKWNLQMTPCDIVRMVEEAQKISSAKGNADGKEAARRPVAMLPMQKYLVNLEDINREYKLFPLFNQMIYIIPVFCELDGAELNRAFLEIQQVHDAFHLRFSKSGNRYRMESITKPRVPLRVINEPDLAIRLFDTCRGLPLSVGGSDADWLYHNLEDIEWDCDYPFRLIYVRGREKGALVLSVHHAIFDYYSLMYFMEELNSRYESCMKAEPRNFLIDYAAAYSRFARENEVRQQGIFWDSYLSDVCRTDWRGIVSAMAKHHKADSGTDVPIYFNSGASRQYSCKIPASLCGRLREFCIKYQVGEFAVLFTLLVSAIYENIHDMSNNLPAAILFYSNGRSRLKPVNTIGFFSFLLPFKIERPDERQSDFVQLALNAEEELTRLKSVEHGFWHMLDSERRERIVSDSVIFDYQKLCSSSADSFWKSIMPFECVGNYNPFSFRIYNYGDYAEISVLYNVEFTERDGIAGLVQAYLDAWEENIQIKTKENIVIALQEVNNDRQ